MSQQALLQKSGRFGEITAQTWAPSRKDSEIKVADEHEEMPPSLLGEAGLTTELLTRKTEQAQKFHRLFLSSSMNDESGAHFQSSPEHEKFIRRSGGIPQAVLNKLGSNSFSKRRPENIPPYLAYLQNCHDSRSPLILRLLVGPVKNVHRFGSYQQPDLAEYLMFIQLARLVEAIASLYPHGVTVQMIPDDERGKSANGWPEAFSRRYVTGLQQMAKDLNFGPWIQVENGQSRLYDLYHVKKYFFAAKEEVIRDPLFSVNYTRACLKARENLFSDTAPTLNDIRDSALRYLVSHKAETLSGMWSPKEALPIVYAFHPGHYQLYTMGTGLTKLPWQIKLPIDCIPV